ncbi:UNKNOWN [Stylonychia lemnae]|uniref:YHYH domain-containing protein n=1 Tax=Stylonychia lemnae TaxID=5949 RepID=A0A077ZSI2_STYLE|nr:UNKNOWN [Stylonychia lemnae]|eukprot:CDW72519.1 UNKNOWN [Stylonychia lemnae]
MAETLVLNNSGKDKLFGIHETSNQTRLLKKFIPKNSQVGILGMIVLGYILCPIQKVQGAASFFGNTLASCEEFAATFDNTCGRSTYYVRDSGSDPFSGMDGAEVSCVVGTTCPFTGATVTEDTPCVWERKLCVTCASYGLNAAKIRIQSNGLPNHCYSPDQPPNEVDIDFEVVYNWQAPRNRLFKNLTTTAQLDAVVCNATTYLNDKINNTLADLEVFGDYSLNETVGITINGVLLKSGVNATGYDVLYPKKKKNEYIGRLDLDACLGTTLATSTGIQELGGTEDASSDGVYHYHSMSPCIYSGSAQEYNFTCDKEPNCKKNVYKYISQNVTDSLRSIYPVGLAKDGRMIYSPFRIDGNVWDSCDVDVCNGRYFNGYYGYVMTPFFPYSVGCWGPGNNIQDKKIIASCSSNSRQCPYEGKFGANSLYLSAFSMVSLLAMMVFLA